MTFNREELTAVFKMAKAMVMADGNVKPSEVAVISRELQRFGVPSNQVEILLEASDNMEASQAIVFIAGMDEERKKYIASYLGVIMASDGDINDNEISLWRLVSTLCGLPTMNIADAISNMANL